MAKRKQTEELVEKLLEPIAEARGVRIYDVEYVKEGQEYYLRAYIDKGGGVTIDDEKAALDTKVTKTALEAGVKIRKGKKVFHKAVLAKEALRYRLD